MGDAPEQEGAHGDVDHWFGDVQVSLVEAHQLLPADHPAVGPLHRPVSWPNLPADLAARLGHDRGGEAGEHRLGH